MNIPNGLTLKIMNKVPVIRALGNVVLNPKEQDFVHFTTTKQLREALRLNSSRDIKILEDIPESVLALLETAEEVIPEEEAPPNNSGVIYRDEFMKYQEQTAFAQIRVVAEDPPDAQVGWMWMIDPDAPATEGAE